MVKWCTQGAISDVYLVFLVQPSNVQTRMTTVGITCLNQRGQASGWCNVKAKLRWGVFLFSHLFKMLSDHQHLTCGVSRPHEGLHTELAPISRRCWDARVWGQVLAER